MKIIRKFLDGIKPKVQKGGKFEKLHSTFDAFESFLFVPAKTAPVRGAHIRDVNDMKRSMTMVIMALVPAMLFGMWNAGYQYALASGGEIAFWPNIWFGFLKLLPLLIVSYGVGLAIEFASAQIRGHEVNEGYLVSGMIIPLIMPVDVSLWILALAVAFSVVFVKEIFGGTGMNIWNPALMARAFVFFAYPSKISGDKVWIADGITGATPLANASDAVSTGSTLDQLLNSLPSFKDMFLGTIPGSFGETSTLCILLGALFLLIVGVANWKIMLSVFAGGAAMGLIFNIVGANAYMQMPFYYHFVMGGFAFGAVFMATDPVSAAQTEIGKWWYGALIGAFAVLLRVVNPAYPEGMMLSILFMNTMAPLIDHFVVEANIKRRLKK